VSSKTVSNVVNDFVHVAPATREKVLRSIAELGYQPNVTARRLVTGRTGTLELAVSDVSLPYFAELARRISRIAASRGYRLLLEQTGSSIQAERAVLHNRESGLVDGLIFQPSLLGTEELAEYTVDTPVVLLGENAVPEAVDSVMIDNVSAAREATAHLLRLGRRRVAFVGHEAYGLSETSRQRIQGFREALTRIGIAPDPALEIAAPAISSQAAADAVGRALDAGLVVDAVFCRDDLSALGTLRALHERGHRVPEDVAVVGWDDVAMSAFMRPTLTTVRPDAEELARLALEMLEQRIAGQGGPGRHVLVGHTLVVRESAP